MTEIDLNVDAGESFGAWRMGDDAALFAAVSSANLACGFHAGDPGTIRVALAAAIEAGVAIGAHPGLPDLVGFGRRPMTQTPQEVRDDTLYQVGAMSAFVRAAGATLHHVKPHGALNTAVAESSDEHAGAIVAAVREFDPELPLVAIAGSRLQRAAERHGAPGRRRGLPGSRVRAGRLARHARHTRRDHPRRRRRRRARRSDGAARHGRGDRRHASSSSSPARCASTATTRAASRRHRPFAPRSSARASPSARSERWRRSASTCATRRSSTQQANLRVLALAAALAATKPDGRARDLSRATARSTSSGTTRRLSNERATAWIDDALEGPRGGAARPAPRSPSRCATAASTPTTSRRPRAEPGRDRASATPQVEYRVCARATVGQPMMGGDRRAPARPAAPQPENGRSRARGGDRQRADDDLPRADAGRLERDRHRAGQRLRPAPR